MFMLTMHCTKAAVHPWKNILEKTVEEVLPQAASSIKPLLKRIYSNREKILDIEIPCEVPVRPGEIIHYLASFFPISEIEGNPKFIGGVFVDITDRKREEDALRDYSERLEDMVKERTGVPQGVQEELVRERKLTALGRLAGCVCHELRNPLGVISNAVYYLKMVLPDSEESIREYLETISSEVDHSLKIISNILYFSSITAVDKREIAVAKLISRVLEVQPAPENIDVIIAIPSDLPPQYGNMVQMEQIFGNLVTNAYQAMPEGGTLTIEAKANRNSGHILITDTGRGIPKDNMEKLF